MKQNKRVIPQNVQIFRHQLKELQKIVKNLYNLNLQFKI